MQSFPPHVAAEINHSNFRRCGNWRFMTRLHEPNALRWCSNIFGEQLIDWEWESLCIHTILWAFATWNHLTSFAVDTALFEPRCDSTHATQKPLHHLNHYIEQILHTLNSGERDTTSGLRVNCNNFPLIVGRAVIVAHIMDLKSLRDGLAGFQRFIDDKISRAAQFLMINRISKCPSGKWRHFTSDQLREKQNHSSSVATAQYLNVISNQKVHTVKHFQTYRAWMCSTAWAETLEYAWLISSFNSIISWIMSRFTSDARRRNNTDKAFQVKLFAITKRNPDNRIAHSGKTNISKRLMGWHSFAQFGGKEPTKSSRGVALCHPRYGNILSGEKKIMNNAPSLWRTWKNWFGKIAVERSR
jgi:hypothetical protein